MQRKHRTLLVNIIVVMLIVSGLLWIASLFFHPGARAWTDNAQVRRDIVVVNSRVQGFATKVLFSDFQHVEAGDTLVLIEDAQYRLQAAQAEAGYQNAQVAKSAQGTTIRTTQNSLSVADAELDEVRLQVQQAEKEYLRYKNLLASESVTRQQYERMETAYLTLKARYDKLVRQKQSTSLVKSEQTQRLDQNEAAIAVAEAQVELARLNLGYTVVTAPCSGRTGRRSIQEGELLHTGQELLTIVSDGPAWVEANFRERQLRHVEVGTRIKITVDALRGMSFTGVVESIADATGAQFSSLPVDNSTGNFVKVEQLIPVKIALPDELNNADELRMLKSGMNVEVKVQR